MCTGMERTGASFGVKEEFEHASWYDEKTIHSLGQMTALSENDLTGKYFVQL